MAAGVARRRWRSLDRDRTAGAHSPPRRHSEDPCGAFGSPRSRVAASSRVPPPSPAAPPSNVSPPRTTEAADGAWAISSPAGSLRVRNEGDRGDVHLRRWRTGSTSRRRARAPCTPGRSWPNGSSPARTRRSPSSRSGVTRGLVVRCVRRCASAGGRRCEDRGAGRATLSCGRSLCVRTLRAVVSRVAPGRACGTGSETAPTFGDTSLARSAWANERTRADGSEALSHFWPITNSRISESDDTHTSRRRSACTFSGEGRTCRHIWRARHGVASTSPSSLGRRHRRCRCVDPRGREPWIPGQSPRPTGAPVVRDPDDERAPRWLFQPPLTTPFIHPPLDRTARGRRL